MEGVVDLDLELVYVRSERRFYLTEIDNKIYTEWHNTAFDDCEYYNTEDAPTHALEDGVWGCEQDSRYYRYNSATGEIEPLPMLRYATSGLHELLPTVLFPGAQHLATLERKRLSSVFDTTFDDTFITRIERESRVRLIVDHRTAGYYLRWTDRHGCLQYYLFSKGQRTLKNKPSSDALPLTYAPYGMHFGSNKRLTVIEGTVTCKCCATSLTKEVYEYVSTIATAVIVDLYRGTREDGTELWEPVCIQSSSCNYHPKEQLHSLEITLTLPDINAQSLCQTL